MIPDPRDYIIGVQRDAVFTLSDVECACKVNAQKAKRAVCMAFSEGTIYPMCRRIGTDKWHVHLLAIAQMELTSTEFEVAFIRR